jgi:hypothetical protein
MTLTSPCFRNEGDNVALKPSFASEPRIGGPFDQIGRGNINFHMYVAIHIRKTRAL